MRFASVTSGLFVVALAARVLVVVVIVLSPPVPTSAAGSQSFSSNSFTSQRR
jgi:hypothetical protein